MTDKTSAKKTFAERAQAEPTELQKRFADWIEEQTGVKPDLKSVQLACALRMDFQHSDENQEALQAKKRKAAEDKKKAAERKRAKLEAELAKLKGETAEASEPVADEPDGGHEEYKASMEEVSVSTDPVELVVVYGGSEPEVHKKGCADLRKLTKKGGYSKEPVKVSSHTELTENIYSDQINSGESTVEECLGGYDAKPCCPNLND